MSILSRPGRASPGCSCRRASRHCAPAAILLVEGFQKGRTRNPDREAYATRSFRRFFRTVEFCFWSVSGRGAWPTLAGGLAGRAHADVTGEAALGAADFLSLAAAPTFAPVVLLSCVFWSS